MGALALLPALAVLGLATPSPSVCARWHAPLLTVRVGTPTFIHLEPIGTCMRLGDKRLFYVYALENTSEETSVARVLVHHFTPGGLSMGTASTSLVTLRPGATEYVLSESAQQYPFPVRDRDVFVAAIGWVQVAGRRWLVDQDEVLRRSRRAVREWMSAR